MSALTALSNVADGRLMKGELQELRRRGALRASDACSLGDATGVRSCGLCRAGLGWIVNRGAVCQACRKRVCKACREYTVRTVDWVCTVCYKRTQLQTATGEWMNEFIKKPRQWKDSKIYLSPAEIIKSTIRRSWTICDPNPRWTSSRDSPEFRPYNSLPRGRDVTDYPSLITQRSVPTSGQSVDTIGVYEKTDDIEGHSPRQRRVSQFERTLSELYGTQKKPTRKMSTSDENGVDKTSTEDENQSTTSSNGFESSNKKTPELKPTKIPSPRKKVQYTRSETSVVYSSAPKQQIRKQNSLQPYKKKDRSTDEPLVQEKHVSFDYESTKRSLDVSEGAVSGKSSSEGSLKSGIPKRDFKSRKSEARSSVGDIDGKEANAKNDNKIVEVNLECDINNENLAQVEIASETEKPEVEPGSGAIFRKVTIRRRRQDFRKTQAFDEGRKHHSSESEFLDADTGRILLPEGDDYKLVFISSDSSSKEEDVDDNDSASSSSAATAHSLAVDDCDWDYFEPSPGARPVLCWSNRNSPFGSPRVYRRGVAFESPLGSPLVYRRARTRESETGTDDDATRGIDSGSPVSSDSCTAGFLSRMRSPSDTEDHHLAMDATSIYVDHQAQIQQQQQQQRQQQQQQQQCVVSSTVTGASDVVGDGNVAGARPPCQSCGAIAPTPPPTQFVPIPVLVPIPVPIPAIWNPLDAVILCESLDSNMRARLRAIQQRTGALLWPCVNPASLIAPLISPGGDASTLLPVQHSVCEAETTSMLAASERNSSGATAQTIGEHAAGGGLQHEREHEPGSNADNTRCGKNASVSHGSASDQGEPNRADDPRATGSTTGAANDDKCVTVSSSASAVEVYSELTIGGYLASENTYMSSSESEDSGDSDVDDEVVGKPRVHRMYNVSGENMRDSDEALPSSEITSECDENEDEDDTGRVSHSSDRHDDLSSSGSADTDSDDTGTVADQKPKKFSKVFVVNASNSSSNIEDSTDNSSDTDTSDNDTDTEKDCIVLNYIRSLDDVPQEEIVEDSIEPVVLLKHIKSEEHFNFDLPENVTSSFSAEEKSLSEQNSTENSVVLLKHVILDTLQENSNATELTVSNKICVSDSVYPKSNSLSRNDVNDTDNNGTVGVDISALANNEESETNAGANQDNDKKCQDAEENAISQCSDVSASDQFVSATLANEESSAHCTELIAPTADCIVRVSEENKHAAHDLETDARANDPCTSALSQSQPDTPLEPSANEAGNSSSAPRANCVAGESAADPFPQEEKLGVAGEQSEVAADGSNGSEWNASAGIRSADPVSWQRGGARAVDVCGVRGARTGAPSAVDSETARHVPAARYTSLVMITQEPPAPAPRSLYPPQVSVVPSDTTTIVPAAATDSDVIVQHTNWQDVSAPTKLDESADTCEFGDEYYALDSGGDDARPRKSVLVTKAPVHSATSNDMVMVVTGSDTLVLADSDPASNVCDGDGVTVVTGGDTLSAVMCLEEGLADDDSWVEDISHDEDEFATTTATDSSSGEEVTLPMMQLDQEEELRGYHRSAIDFTLHTIVEESCEESEVEQFQMNNKKRPTSATDLEKYFFFRLGDGTVSNVNEDAFSETSSIYSEGMDSLGAAEETNNDGGDPAELASSRLEKYFLSGFMGFTAERRDSDGSVGSDSEGRPSPEQRRKRLVRARGTGRSHSSSLDNLLANAELSGTEPQLNDSQQLSSEDSSSSETDTYDEPTSIFEKSDGQFDTVKRKKCKKQRVISGGSSSPHEEKKSLETTMEETNENKDSDGDDDGHKTPQPEFLLPMSVDLANSRKQQSRDSGFIGSCDDLLKEQKTTSDSVSSSADASPSTKTLELKNDLEKITEEKRTVDEKQEKFQHHSVPPATTLTRKDSFNNWSSDEETNLMMCKMRQFFKTMVASGSNAHLNPPSKPTTPVLTKQNSPRPVPSPRTKNRNKPPQLVYFENELTRLMKTVPGIRDDQVREIVEYLSSEDTWSDSYDSSDYTSSDLEGTAVAQKSVLQQQISASCQQIISKFDKNADDEEGDEGDGGIIDESQGLNRETAFVYQKLVASFNKMTSGDGPNGELTQTSPHNSPPLIAKVMHHIGSRLVALMHEVSSGESHCSTSPKVRYHHRRLQQKLSSASTTTTEDDDSTSDSNLPDRLTALEDMPHNILPRSRSHDLLLGDARAHHHSSSGVSDIAEEREASDYERFSWRGSFESALMATDSRTKLSLLGAEGSASASALAMAAKRRSAGDLLFSPKSLSREQLDRVRSCGSIGGGGNSEEKHWVVSPAVRPNRRRSSVPDATCGSGGSADGEDDDDEDLEGRSTLPRSLQTNANTTNSLPRLPTTATAANMHKAHSVHHFLPHNVKSARYRPPGFNRALGTAGPKRAVSAPGLQPSHPRRDGRRRSQQTPVALDDISTADSSSSPVVGPKSGSKSASPSPIHGNTLTRGSGSVSSADWQENDDDIDRLVAMHHNRNSLSSLGLRSDSMASVYSGAGEGRYGIVAVRGQVEFALQYNYKAGALEIHVKQCKDLAAVDAKRNRSDPYVKVYLLPDKSKGGKRKTKVKKHTLNPVFDECLKFHSSLSGLETRTLWLTVWHSDMFGRNDFLGEVMMPLENKVFDDPTPKWYNLQERTEPFEDLPSYKGDVIVGLKFVPPDMTIPKKGKRSRGALHVLVKEAKSLTAVKANGTSDPFCKSYLLPDKGRGNKQKTPILRRTTNPVWNHTFIYDDVTLQELAERALELTVWDHDRLASNEFLGGVRFSLGTNKHYGKNVDWMDATGKEMALWQSMLERPNFWVEGCVTLRPSLDNRVS